MTWLPGLSTGIDYMNPIERTLRPLREAGFSTIEVSTAPGHFDYSNPAAVTALAHRATAEGLRIHSLHAPFGQDIDITSPDEGARTASLDRLMKAADALAGLGGRYLVVHPGSEDVRWSWSREECIRRSVLSLQQVAMVCADRGLTLAVETPLPHLLGGDPTDLDWILQQLPEEHVGVCIDTSHCSLGGHLIESIVRFRRRLVHVQVSDNHGVNDDHLVPGWGVIDWARVCATLEAARYRGIFMLEVTGTRDASHDARDIAAAVQSILDPTRISAQIREEAASRVHQHTQGGNSWSLSD